MPKLTPAQVTGFLEEPGHLVRIATVRPDAYINATVHEPRALLSVRPAAGPPRHTRR